MAHEDYKEMLAAEALGALDAGDAIALEAHLQSCSECSSQRSEWENTAASLAFAALGAKTLEPSPQLRSKILEAVRNDAAVVTQAKTTDGDRAPASNVIPLSHGRLRTWTAAQAWGAIAAGLVFVILFASLFILWNQNRAARRELARLSEQVRDAQEQVSRQREAIEIMAAPGTRMSELSGTSVMPDAHAMLAYDKSGRAILMAKGLPPAPAGKAYQLWFIADGRPMPGKVFTTDESGTATMNDQVPVEARNAATFAITLEPENGVRLPTCAICLSSQS
jgi:hypothetical protein